MNSHLGIQGFIHILKRRRTIFIGAVSACLLLGIIACIVAKPRYKAMGVIEIQKSATDGLGLENLASHADDQPSDAMDATMVLQTQAKILESNSLALKVIEDLNLENAEDFKPTFNPIGWVLDLFAPDGQPDPPNAAFEDSPRRRDHAIKVLEKHLKIEPEPGTRLIDIQYTSSNPTISAAVANDIAKSLVDYELNSRFAATSQVSTWLAGQLGDIKNEAAELQGKVETLQRESGVYSLGIADAEGKELAYSATLDRLQQATQALSTATSNRILKGGLSKIVQNGDPDLISGLAGSSIVGTSAAMNDSFALLQNLRTQQAALTTQYASDLSKFGSANPKLVDEKASLDTLNATIGAEVRRIGERARNDYNVAQIVENNTRAVYTQERNAADNQNDKAIALLIAQQEAADARRLYQTLFSHLKEAGVLEGLRSSNVAVVDTARAPSKPTSVIPIFLALSLFCGCFVGSAGALFAEATNNRIDGLATIESLLHTRILAILPMIQPAGHRWRLANGNQDFQEGKLVLLDGPNTAYVEALRGLRTALLQPATGVSPKTILVTSASERVGKSTMSLNLAAALALNGSRVLLVDADMRNAGLSGYIGLEGPPSVLADAQNSGLSGALTITAEPAIISPFPELPKLSVLPAGAAPTYPAELLGSERMRTLVKEWSESYDHILLDSPPILAVADARIISRLADTTLLVVRSGHSTQKSVERAYQILHDAAGRQVDIVVNGMHRKSMSYSEFYGYQGTTYYTEA